MQKILLLIALISFTEFTFGQTKNYKFGITAGGTIQQYNGNLGNSFFKFNTTCFAGFSTNLGIYINESFDFNVGGSIGHFGYCQTIADATRFVSYNQKCIGCTDKLGMGELRSLMVSGNVSIKYKLANDYLLDECSKFAPYIYGGIGINRLSDNMKRQCVNVGNHFTVNGGAGVKYNINKKFSVSYNLGIARFMTKKVYYTNVTAGKINNMALTQAEIQLERRKDMCMQHALLLGFNF